MNTSRNSPTANISFDAVRRRIRACLTRAVVAVAVVACCGIARGEGRTAELRDLHQKQIAEKSESDRARLQRNFREFRGLPAAEQERLRLLNRELKEDDRDQGGLLRAVMGQYHDWLSTLTVGQREDLRRQTDPNMREKRVRELLRQQQEHAESTGSPSGPRAQRGLSSDDLDAVLGVIEKAMRNKQILSDEEKEQLHTKVGLARHMYIMELAFKGGPGAPPRQQLWMGPNVFQAMIAGVTNPRQQNFLKSKEKPEERRWGLFSLIRAGLMSEYEAKKPDAATLELFFVQLPSDRQDEIMRLPYDQQQQKLTHMYLGKKSEDDPNHYPRPPKPGFWMQRPAGFRPLGQAMGGQRGAEGNQSQKENGRKKNTKNPAKKDKTASETDEASEKPEG